jgi:hypothetical protein
MQGLKQLCFELGIRSDNISTEEYNSRFRGIYNPENTLKTAIEIDKISNHKSVVLGGLTTYPQLLGYRFLRMPSNDVDCVTNFEGLFNIRNHFKDNPELFYSSDHDGVSLIHNNCPVGFWIDKIRDWETPRDFFDSAIPLFFPDGQVTCCAPEYTIMLKLRRAKQKQRIFGKDKIDISSLLLAPYFRLELKGVDIKKTSELIKEHLYPTEDEVNYWITSLKDAEKQLNSKEKVVFESVYEDFKTSLFTQNFF